MPRGVPWGRGLRLLYLCWGGLTEVALKLGVMDH